MPLVIESQLTQADWAAFLRVWAVRVRARVGSGRQLGLALAPLLLGLLVVQVQTRGGDPFAVIAFVVGVVAALVAILSTAHVQRRFNHPDDDGMVLGKVRMELSSDGFRTTRKTSSALTQWSAVRDLTVTDSHVFLWIDRMAAYIVPLRDLPDGLDAKGIVERIREFAGPIPEVQASYEGAPALPTPVESLEPPTVAPGFLALLGRRLTWRTTTVEGAASSDAMIFVCSLITLGLWLAYDRLAAGSASYFYPSGVADIAWYASGVLALGWVMHRASSSRTPGLRPLLASMAGALPLLLVLGMAVNQWAPTWAHHSGYALLTLAGLIHAKRALASPEGRQQPLVLLAGALFALLFGVATSSAWVNPHLWFASSGEDEDGPDTWAESERMLFELPSRIDAAAARIGAGRAGRPDVFFVGFAGEAEQKVFAEELKLAERVVTERYHATGRSLLLVNDQRDHDAWPIATVQGLRRALVRVGERMDPAEDVLFLMLTSHGSDERGLSVSNGAWPLPSLDGQELRSALDGSGIRWRVIVISACHSGAFIQPLADENTIVLTAAAQDRTSFGCGDDDELTYFGGALLRDALPRAESLSDAFEQAKQAIASRERKELLGASLPQAHYGRAIRDYWARVEALNRAEGPGAERKAKPAVLPVPRFSP